MSSARRSGACTRIAGVLHELLSEGRQVEIDGLGVFRPNNGGGFEFIHSTRPRVFLAYVEEDLAAVRGLFEDFLAAGFDPWLDKEKLLPGQNWPRAIERAIRLADFFVACFSRRAVSKTGGFQSELRYALDCAARLPLDDVYFIPLRLEECELPERIASQTQYADLFPDREAGVARVVASIRRQMRRRARALRLAG
jgi:hypothetical protein